jgi:ABC-type antimicrobial peptide transport system permease subunit
LLREDNEASHKKTLNELTIVGVPTSGSGVNFGKIFQTARRNFFREGRQSFLPILTIGTGATLIFVTQVFAGYLRAQAQQIAGLFGTGVSSESIFSSTYWISVIVLIIGALEAAIVMGRNVVKRTREIGIMKAVGINSKTISALVVLETFYYGVLGGVVGVLGGFVTILLLALSQLSLQPLFLLLPGIPEAVIYAFALAVISSVVAGLYPSYRALRLSVLEAVSQDV